MPIPLKRLSHGAMAEKMNIKLVDLVKDDDTGKDNCGPWKHLFRVGGFISKTAIKTTTYGDSTKFGGDFRATFTNPLTGETEDFTSPIAYLPGALEGPLTNAWNGRPVGAKEMTFLFDVSIRKIVDTQGVIKYEFDGTPHKEVPLSDRMSALFKEAPALIEGPKPTKAKVKTKAKAKTK